MISTAGNLGEIQDLMTTVTGDAAEVTPFVSTYLAICAVAKNGIFELDSLSTLAKIKQA